MTLQAKNGVSQFDMFFLKTGYADSVLRKFMSYVFNRLSYYNSLCCYKATQFPQLIYWTLLLLIALLVFITEMRFILGFL